MGDSIDEDASDGDGDDDAVRTAAARINSSVNAAPSARMRSTSDIEEEVAPPAADLLDLHEVPAGGGEA